MHLRPPTVRDRDEFLARVRESRSLHRPWTYPPSDSDEFSSWLKNSRRPESATFLVCRNEDGALAGVVALSQIFLGPFRSAYLGYYVFAPHQGAGYVSEAVGMLIPYVFSTMGLHRLEANIQPGNTASLALARRCGFRYEGFSPRYLKVGGRWQDHERWAITKEDRASSRTA